MRINKFVVSGIAVVAGLASFGVYSTTLDIVDSSAFSAGSSTIAAGCIASATTNAGTPALVGSTWKISSVTVGGNFASCSGSSTVKVVALDSSNVELASNTVTVTALNSASGVVSLSAFNAGSLAKFALLVGA